MFLLKLVVLLQLKGHPLVQPDAGLDTTAYAELARRVVNGDLGLGPGLYYVSPLYIYFLAAVVGLTDSFTVVRFIQIVLGTASVGFIFFTARIWFGERAAWIAAILAALTGLFTFYEVLILQAGLDAFLTSAALYFLTRGLEGTAGSKDPASTRKDSAFKNVEPRVFRPGERGTAFALTGVLLGLATLNRPNMGIAVVALAAALLVVRRIRPAVARDGGRRGRDGADCDPQHRGRRPMVPRVVARRSQLLHRQSRQGVGRVPAGAGHRAEHRGPGARRAAALPRRRWAVR